jgi:hypothetical protein
MDHREYSRGWLRAFLDGEGSVSLVGGNGITFSNTERGVIDDAIRHLAVFGITPLHHTAERDGLKPIYRLVVGRRPDVVTFIHEIGSSIPYKRKRMDDLLAWYARPGQQRRNKWWGPPMPSPEEVDARLGILLNSLGGYKKRYGLQVPRRKAAQPDPEAVRRAYWDEGLSLVEVSARFGYKGNSICQFMRRHNIPRKKLGWQNSRHLATH